MNVLLAGKVISEFKPYSMIINGQEDIVWLSKNLEMKLENLKQSNIKSLFGMDLYEIIVDKDSKVSLGNEVYKLEKFNLSNEEYSVIALEEMDDFNNPKVRAFSMEQIIENLYDGVLVSDKDGRVIIYNEAMEELEKKDAKDMLGKYIWDAYGYSDISKSEHMRVFESGVPIVDRYKAHAYNNGHPIYKSYSTMPIINDGEVIGVYSISKNETKLQSLLSEIVELKRQFSETDENKSYSNGTRYNFSDIIGSSQIVKKVIEEAQAISWLDNNILIVGDTGTGKEVFAQSIHNHGKYKAQPFIGINCSAIPENLLESILFGTVKGSYTGALDSSGLFEEAGAGTLFLDELNSMPINMQTKLLRVLQERSVRRIGGKKNHPIRCRVISAINEDPYMLMDQGRLRQDLFYRIAGYNLYIPSLKARGNDLFELSEYYIRKYNPIMNKNAIHISSQLRDVMDRHNWPGNIRELEHFIENVMVRTSNDDTYLRAKNIPDYILDKMDIGAKDYVGDLNNAQTLQDRLDDMEKSLIERALDENLWNVTKTASKLGLTRQSLIYRMRKFNLERD